MQGDLLTMLGCLKYILEFAISMTPTSKNTSDELDADADDVIDLDDSPSLQHNDEE